MLGGRVHRQNARAATARMRSPNRGASLGQVDGGEDAQFDVFGWSLLIARPRCGTVVAQAAQCLLRGWPLFLARSRAGAYDADRRPRPLRLVLETRVWDRPGRRRPGPLPPSWPRAGRPKPRQEGERARRNTGWRWPRWQLATSRRPPPGKNGCAGWSSRPEHTLAAELGPGRSRHSSALRIARLGPARCKASG